MKLKLDRPLVFIDCETTGPNAATDRVIQLACVKVRPDGTRSAWKTNINPECAIPPEATEVHGLTAADVEGAPTFAAVGPGLAKALEGCDLAGFGVRKFDWPLLQAEFKRAGIAFSWKPRIVDALQVFFRYHPRDLTAAVRRYLGKELEGAHDAMADVEASLQVLEAQFQEHEELPASVEELEALLNPRDPNAIDEEGKFRWRGDVPVVAFGKHNGTPMQKIDPGFYRWMLSNDFPEDTKELARGALANRYPVRAPEAVNAVA